MRELVIITYAMYSIDGQPTYIGSECNSLELKFTLMLTRDLIKIAGFLTVTLCVESSWIYRGLLEQQ